MIMLAKNRQDSVISDTPRYLLAHEETGSVLLGNEFAVLEGNCPMEVA